MFLIATHHTLEFTKKLLIVQSFRHYLDTVEEHQLTTKTLSV